MTSKPERYHGLDLLRGFAMMLGLLMHGSLAYTMPDFAASIGLPSVALDDVDDWIYLLTGWIHVWRMPLFFILAGFFGCMVLQRRGAGGFLTDRLLRIGLALLVFAAILDAVFPPFDFELGHLWFLYYLMGVTALASGATWLAVRVEAVASLGRALAWPFQRLRTMPLYLLPLIALTPAAREQGWAVIPAYFGDFDVLAFLYYVLWFGMGAALYQHRTMLTAIKHWAVITLSFVIATVAMLWALEALFATEGDPVKWYDWAPAISISAAAWCLFFIGLSLRILREKNPVVTWFVQLSYPIYILHLHPAVLFGALFLGWGWSAGWAFWPTVAGSFVASVSLYYLLIKFTPLDWLLTGPRKAWFRPHWIGIGKASPPAPPKAPPRNDGSK